MAVGQSTWNLAYICTAKMIQLWDGHSSGRHDRRVTLSCHQQHTEKHIPTQSVFTIIEDCKDNHRIDILVENHKIIAS